MKSPESTRPKTYGIAPSLSALAVVLACAGCAGSPTLTQGIETAALKLPVPTTPTTTPASQAQTTPPQAIPKPAPTTTAAAQPSALDALNPLPALGQLASTLGKIEPTKPEPETPPLKAAQAVPIERTAHGRIGEERTVLGKTTELYERLARGVHACFMGGRGPLARTHHLFQGEAKPEAKGGTAEITVHEKDTSQQFPRGLTVLRIGIEPAAAESVKVEVSTIRLPADLAQAVRADVLAWAQGQTSQCQAQVVRPPAPIPVVAPSSVKTKKKPAAQKKAPAPAPAKT